MVRHTGMITHSADAVTVAMSAPETVRPPLGNEPLLGRLIIREFVKQLSQCHSSSVVFSRSASHEKPPCFVVFNYRTKINKTRGGVKEKVYFGI